MKENETGHANTDVVTITIVVKKPADKAKAKLENPSNQ